MCFFFSQRTKTNFCSGAEAVFPDRGVWCVPPLKVQLSPSNICLCHLLLRKAAETLRECLLKRRLLCGLSVQTMIEVGPMFYTDPRILEAKAGIISSLACLVAACGKTEVH